MKQLYESVRPSVGPLVRRLSLFVLLDEGATYGLVSLITIIVFEISKIISFTHRTPPEDKMNEIQ